MLSAIPSVRGSGPGGASPAKAQTATASPAHAANAAQRIRPLTVMLDMQPRSGLATDARYGSNTALNREVRPLGRRLVLALLGPVRTPRCYRQRSALRKV